MDESPNVTRRTRRRRSVFLRRSLASGSNAAVTAAEVVEVGVVEFVLVGVLIFFFGTDSSIIKSISATVVGLTSSSTSMG